MAEPVTPPDDEPHGALHPPRFTLRTLLVIVTAVACLFGVMSAVGTLWSLGILLVLTLVSAHVVGNAVGTRLRDGSARRPAARHAAEPAAAGHQPIAQPKRLREPARLHWVSLVMAAAGAVTGGYFGGGALAASYPEATMAAVLLGYASSGVLGGFAGFAAGSFLLVMRQALSEAHAGSDRRGHSVQQTDR